MTTAHGNTTAPKTQEERVAKCPACSSPAAPRNEKAFPFCSKRCSLVDLSKWLNDDYIVQKEIAIPSTVELRRSREHMD